MFLSFAELEDMNVISVDRFRQAVGHRLSEEQLLNVNASLWGFLGQRLTGSAETLFDGAGPSTASTPGVVSSGISTTAGRYTTRSSAGR